MTKTKEIFLEDAGWHFTYTGSLENIKLKQKSIAEYRKRGRKEEELEKAIKNGIFFIANKKIIEITYIPLDSSFPRTLTKFKKKYSSLIKEI